MVQIYFIRLQYLFLTAFLLGFFQSYSQGTGEEKIQIEDVISKYVQARETKDVDEIRLLFTDDADQLVSSGEWRKGITEMTAGMLRSSTANPGDRSITPENIRFIGKQVAIADCRYVIENTEGGEDRKMWSTFILTNENGSWRISAIRNMLPAR